MRKQIRQDLLVTSWDPSKNRKFSKRGIDPQIKEEAKYNCFSVFLRTYIEDSPLLIGTIAQEMDISMSSLSNYLYKGHNPNYDNLMGIIKHIANDTGKNPGELLLFLYENWKIHNEK